ncbi:YihY/virulence factor BrkB family protein [Flagellimonas marinaquae]|uniref:YihY/virulence factor BrkB family protein n=1 Tax=Flagellimonas aurea TaxID=2915619 RepID=A0ABS3G458_9FLAO|nr:YihY/virulence factor BrkB family protein [Allomuricauda aurea]MAO16421.1 ribonuclease BN [Allomuricauda sp.]MBO0354209.1 YihY/virulence factor BrkB family protein [Allomuricauda aurea]UBZ14143.1 YihY/virulence factor BrkB family protein [Allomuricauda aquimarina]|tara:strand:- start:1297 stop:2277 length:981 start_codon:yes stop_codon:yes gene_type:complete
MSAGIEEQLEKIPVINWIVRLMKKIKLKAFEGLSLYDLIEMYLLGIVKGTLSSRASSIAFSLFLALFPLLIFLVTLIPFIIPYVSVGNENFDAQFLDFLESFLPSATSEYFGEIYQQIKDQKQGGLLSSAFILSIFLVANGVNAIFGGFENSYHVELTRNFFRQYAYALMVGLILSVLLIVGAVAFVYFEFYIVEYTSEYLGKTLGYDVEKGDTVGIQLAKVMFFLFLSYLTTAILYYFGTAEGRNARFFSAGALMTTLLFLLTSYLFGIYVDKFARYNELYGALGGLLILMVFIWLNSNILLLGFELNATLNSLKKRHEKQKNEE